MSVSAAAESIRPDRAVSTAIEKLPKILRSLLYGSTGAPQRWQERRAAGYSDADLAQAIAAELGEPGHRRAAGISLFVRAAGKHPGLWLACHVPVGPPTLDSAALVQQVRAVFKIPLPPTTPEEKLMPTTKRAPAAPITLPPGVERATRANPPAVVQVSLDKIVPNPHNPRGPIKPESIASLVASIAAIGIQSPLLGRAHPQHSDQVELLAGHRRLAAAKRAKLADVPMILQQLSDAQAAEVATIEQIEREDWHPLEEARAFVWLTQTGWDVPSIASRMGKTPRWVAQRLSLNQLTEAWQKRLLSETIELPTGVIERLARLPADTQNALYEDLSTQLKHRTRDGALYDENWTTVDGFEQLVNEDYLRELSKVGWKLDDATLDPLAGACLNCEKRSSVQPLLWESDEDNPKPKRGDRCLDAACFGRKAAKMVQLRVAEVKADHPAAVVIGDREDAQRLGNSGAPVLQEYQVSPAKQSDRGAIPAIDASTGKLKWVRPNSYTPAGDKAHLKKAQQKAGPPSAAEEARARKAREAALEARRQAHVVRSLQAHLKKLANGGDFEVQNLAGPGAASPWLQVCALLAAFGTKENIAISAAQTHQRSAQRGWKDFDARLKARADKPLVADLYRSLFLVWAERLNYFDVGHVGPCHDEAQRIMELLRLNPGAYRAAAEKDIPTPRSWGVTEATKPRSDKATKGKKKLVEMTPAELKASVNKAKKKIEAGFDVDDAELGGLEEDDA